MKKGLIVSFILAMCIFSTSVLAATFNVSTTPELRQALLDAATNGQSDTIVLANGTYATTDDSGGTFTFLDNENYDLTLQGSSAENVILSGDNTHQVLNFNVINNETTIHLDSLSVSYGVSEEDGGGIVGNTKSGVPSPDSIRTNTGISPGSNPTALPFSIR